ncbi:uncharacterized protein IL334_004157 [Kwoniella shivajii]|uniref:Glutaredoxin domain-containing protein n=1 Tax=Kwoniella shivajii TaxID=564305 RepID=A0ABZ1D2K6_9TREE|nr:hypothetical protein IL334_004157 [Kwoniella shivajii]
MSYGNQENQCSVPHPYGYRYNTHRSSNSNNNSSSSSASSSIGLNSPMSLPPLLPEDDHEDLSPASSTSILTPTGPDPTIMSTPKMGSDHSMLSSMSQQPTPKLIIPSATTSSRFALLPPHNPLRSKMYSIPETTSLTVSPPSPAHTPKGHPLDGKNRRDYFAYNSITKTHPITNPYGTDNPSYSTSLSYLLRIPRRLRPFLLVGVCLFTLTLVFMNRAITQANHMDHILHQRDLASDRRYSPLAQTGDQHPLIMSEEIDHARQAEAAVQSIVPLRKGLQFENEQEELAALISFVTSTTSNALPALDPTKTLNPNIVLDFDPTHPNAKEDLALLQNDINAMYPIILIGKMRDPWHREVKRMLAEYKITPAPLVIDVDQRKDHSTITPLLARLLDTQELPQLVLHGKSLGSYHDVLNLRDEGILREKLEESGSITVKDLKRKKKGSREKERIELERVLKPAPIVAH